MGIIIIIIAWIFSPLALIPLFLVSSSKCKKLEYFIHELYIHGRINTYEYENKTEEINTVIPHENNIPPSPIFSDEREKSRVSGENSVKQPAPEIKSFPEKSAAETEYEPDISDREIKTETCKPETPAPKIISENKSEPEKNEYSYRPEKDRAGAMSVLMMIGIIFVVLAGLVFSTAVWVNLGEIGRVLAVLIVAVIFFGISAFTKIKLKLDKTSFAFYTLGTFFVSISFITAGFFDLFGKFLSVNGEGNFVLFSLALAIISVIMVLGRKIFENRPAAYISVFAAALSSISMCVQFSDGIVIFALITAIFTAVINFLLFTVNIRIPESYLSPVRISVSLLNIITVITGIPAVFMNDIYSPSVSAVFVLRALYAIVFGYLKNEKYSETHCAFLSLSSLGLFSLAFISDCAETMEVFALSASIFALIFSLVFFVSELRFPDSFISSAKSVSFVLYAVGIVSSFVSLSDNLGNFNGICYAVAVFHIASCVLSAFLASKENEFYETKTAAFSSLFTALAFTVMLVSEISDGVLQSALILTAIFLVFANALYTLNIKVPDGWKTAVNVMMSLLGITAVSVSLYALGTEAWTEVSYLISAVYILQSAAVIIMAHNAHHEYSKTFYAVVSQIIFILFSLILTGKITPDNPSFICAVVCFGTAYMNFANTLKLKRTSGWDKSVKVFSAGLWISGIILTLSAVIENTLCDAEWTGTLFASAGIIIAYSVFTAVLAFLGHFNYKKTVWAIVSQIVFIVFSLILTEKITPDNSSFICAVVCFGTAYMNLAHTLKLKITSGWDKSVKIFSSVVWLLGIILTLASIIENALYVTEWTVTLFVSAGIIIVYSVFITVLAFLGHFNYKKTVWAVVSILTGSVFTLIILGEILPCTESFVLAFAVYAIMFYTLSNILFVKTPENWINTVKVFDIILNISAAILTAAMLLDFDGSWNEYCYICAALYIVYTSVRGIISNSGFLKAAECLLSTYTLYNIFYAFEEKIDCGAFIFVCMIFALSVIHHFVKPVRTVFSDIVCPVLLLFAAGSCTAECEAYLGVAGFVLLGIIMLLKALENNEIMAKIFRAALPVPVMGIVFSAVSAEISDETAVCAGVLAVIAGTYFIITKKSDIIFYSFSVVSSVLIFIGTGTESMGLLIMLLLTSMALTGFYFVSANNIPSFVSMAGTCAVLISISESFENADTTLLIGVIFAVISFILSRVFFNGAFVKKDKGLSIDVFCTGILFAVMFADTDNEKINAFTVLTLLAVFAGNLRRTENKDGFNNTVLTVAAALFTAALITRPFLTVSDENFSFKINIGIIALFAFAFSKIWADYPKTAKSISTAIHGICYFCLITEALSHQNLFNTITVLGVSAVILLYSFYRKRKLWFAVSSVSLVGLTIYIFRDFFLMIDWWIYLLIVGLILIAVSSANEYFIRKGRELKEKAGRFFEDWTW